MMVRRRHIENVDESLDLRRKQNQQLCEKIVRRAHWLAARDRDIALAYFDRGMNAAEIGSMLRIDPRCVRRRIKHIVSRLRDPRCAYVISHRNSWSAQRRAVAEALFVEGHSMREVSDTLGISLHVVRKYRDAIEIMTQADRETARISRAWQNAEGVRA